MPALDTVSATVTAAAAAPALGNMAAATGDSLIVRAAPDKTSVLLLNCWVQAATAGFFEITSPRLHDNTRGLRFRHTVGESKPLLPFGPVQKVYSQDTLALTLQGAAVAGEIGSASMLLYYEKLEGVDARLIDVAGLNKRFVQLVTVEDTITAGVGGGYTGAEALNAESDLLEANTDYALLGYRASVNCASVCWSGADTGNLRVSGPGDQLGGDYTKEWFLTLSKEYGLPLIPVFNSANRSGVSVAVVQNNGGAAVTLHSIFAQLA
jgi:hypothetical protein